MTAQLMARMDALREMYEAQRCKGGMRTACPPGWAIPWSLFKQK